MNRGNRSIIPYILAIAAIIVVVFGLRAVLDKIDSAPSAGHADNEISIGADETVVEEAVAEETSDTETASEEVSVAESADKETSDDEKTAGTDAKSSGSQKQDADAKEADESVADAATADAEAVSGEESAAGDEDQAAAVEETQTVRDYRFRSKKLLNDHYNKHGIDMGFASAAEYEAAASAVIRNPAVLHKTEKEDGDDVYYVEATNEFVVVSTDGYIRTYFCPDSGIKYYNKQ